MNGNALPLAILAGITGYTATLFIGLYVALAKSADERSRREYLTFALTCLTVSMYDITCVGLYDSRSIQQGFFWMRGNLVTAASFGVAYPVFVWDFLKRPAPLAVRYGQVALCVLGLTVGFWESTYTLTVARPAIKHIELFRREITYYEVEAGILAQLLLLVFFAVFATVVVYMVRYFRSGEGRHQHGQLGVVVATAFCCMAATNDVLVADGAYSFLYVFEYGLAAILMAMGYVLLMRFAELHKFVIVLNRDLSKANADLVTALEQALESVRVKTEFLASISHELRTPLNAIINLPEGLLGDFVAIKVARCTACNSEFELEPSEEFSASVACLDCGATRLEAQGRLVFVGDAEKAQGGLQIVARAARHLLGLVNDILDSSKLELGRTVIVPAEFDVLDLVAEVLDSIRSTAEKANVSINFERPPNDATNYVIVADRVRIGQVLYNLLSNAIKFSRQGGAIEVSLGAPSKGELELHVRDQGIGIAKEHHSMIFEKFRQVDGGSTRAYGGTGLGLAISKALIELHGGRLWVESSLGNGATFYVRLPQRPAQDTTRHPLASAAASSSSSSSSSSADHSRAIDV